MKAYPREDDDWDECNTYRRIAYRRGYEQAEKDFMAKAEKWLDEHMDDYVGADPYTECVDSFDGCGLLAGFKQVMSE